jgi:hypothetical protein
VRLTLALLRLQGVQCTGLTPFIGLTLHTAAGSHLLIAVLHAPILRAMVTLLRECASWAPHDELMHQGLVHSHVLQTCRSQCQHVCYTHRLNSDPDVAHVAPLSR